MGRLPLHDGRKRTIILFVRTTLIFDVSNKRTNICFSTNIFPLHDRSKSGIFATFSTKPLKFSRLTRVYLLFPAFSLLLSVIGLLLSLIGQRPSWSTNLESVVGKISPITYIFLSLIVILLVSIAGLLDYDERV